MFRMTVVAFLSFHNSPIPNSTDETYNLAYEFLRINDLIAAPLSVNDFNIAQYLLKNDTNIPIYTFDDIINASTAQLNRSAERLMLKTPVDDLVKKRIIDILSYMNKISYIESMPIDMLDTIAKNLQLQGFDCIM